MIGLLFLISCREEGVCSAQEPLKSALEERLKQSCDGIRPSEITKLQLSNYPEPISSASILSRFINVQELRMSDTNLSDISFVLHMPRLEILHLDHSDVRDISPLSSASMLEELWLDYTKVSDISALSNLEHIRVLTLRESKILDISPLSNLHKLEVLDVSNTSVFDISPIRKGGNLKALSIRNTQVDSIKALSNHTRLRLLDMRKTRVVDVSPLSSLSELTALDAGQSRIKRLPFLPSVQEFRLDGNPLEPDGCDLVGGIVKEECVRIISTKQHPFVDMCIRRSQLPFHQETTMESLISVMGVQNCSQLFDVVQGDIDIRGVPILDMRLFESLSITSIRVDQEWLWPEFCPKDSSNLAIQAVCTQVHQKNNEQLQSNELGFLKLCRETTDREIRKTIDAMMDSTRTQSCVRLWMSGTQQSEWEVSRKGFSNLEPFAFFPNLKALLLDYNNIVDVSNLAMLPQLQILWLDDNQITDIEPLKSNKNLLWIGLGDNQIEDISMLSSVLHVRRLWLGGNAISDVSTLSSLKHMRKLHLAGNQIQDISALGSLVYLERLYLADNYIADVRPLSSLKRLQFLTVGLDYQESPLEAHHWLLRGNPIVTCPSEGDAPLPIQLACSFVDSY